LTTPGPTHAHTPRPAAYVGVFLALLALTALTVAVSRIDLGPMNTVAALAIAGLKATLVGLYFMHLRWSDRLVRTAALAGIFWLIILVTITLSDYLSRTWLGVPGW
jgi:cytochrome c oxidase subunit 4